MRGLCGRSVEVTGPCGLLQPLVELCRSVFCQILPSVAQQLAQLVELVLRLLRLVRSSSASVRLSSCMRASSSFCFAFTRALSSSFCVIGDSRAGHVPCLAYGAVGRKGRLRPLQRWARVCSSFAVFSVGVRLRHTVAQLQARIDCGSRSPDRVSACFLLAKVAMRRFLTSTTIDRQARSFAIPGEEPRLSTSTKSRFDSRADVRGDRWPSAGT